MNRQNCEWVGASISWDHPVWYVLEEIIGVKRSLGLLLLDLLLLLLLWGSLLGSSEWVDALGLLLLHRLRRYAILLVGHDTCKGTSLLLLLQVWILKLLGILLLVVLLLLLHHRLLLNVWVLHHSIVGVVWGSRLWLLLNFRSHGDQV